MTDTPNARLARVLEILARVARKGSEGAVMVARAMYFASADDGLDTAEVCAAEAARLAGVPVSPWVLVRSADRMALPSDGEPVIVTALDDNGEPYSCSAVLMESEDGTPLGFFSDVTSGDRIGKVIAWTSDWPEPYRPEEATDG